MRPPITPADESAGDVRRRRPPVETGGWNGRKSAFADCGRGTGTGGGSPEHAAVRLRHASPLPEPCGNAQKREGCAPGGPGTRRTARTVTSAEIGAGAGRRGPGAVGNGGIVAYGARSPAPRQRGHAQSRRWKQL